MTTKRTNRSPQKQKSRSLVTRDMLLNMPSQTVPSGKAYKRPKAGSRVDRYSTDW